MLRTILPPTPGSGVLCRLFVRYYHTTQAMMSLLSHHGTVVNSSTKCPHLNNALIRDRAAKLHHVFLHKRKLPEARAKKRTSKFSNQRPFWAHQAICPVNTNTPCHYRWHLICPTKTHRSISIRLLIAVMATLWIGQKCTLIFVLLLFL